MEKTYEGFLNIFKKNKQENTPVIEEPLEPLNPNEIFHEIGTKNVLGKVPTVQDIKDCFADLADLEFTIIVDNLVSYISIRNNKPFKYQEIKECLLFAIPYLQDEYGMRLLGGSISYECRMMKTNTKTDRFDSVDRMNRFLQKNYDKDMYKMDLYIYIKGLTKKE